MSASERLRALDIPDMGEFDFRVAEVRDALPLIADEIEAAEALIEHVRFGGEIDARHPRFVLLARAVALLGELLDANG